MKIISPYKDYYDYLIGIYGEDPLIILDRRNHQQPTWRFNHRHGYINEPQSSKYTLFIAGWLIDFIHYGDKFYYGEEILQIPDLKLKENYYLGFHENIYSNELKNNFLVFHQDGNSNPIKIFKNPAKIDFNVNFSEIIALIKFNYNYKLEKYECIILYSYPKLSDVNLNKFIKAETVYQWIYNYISEKNLEKEQHQDLRTDIQKLEGKGFDKKISFRNIK